MTLLHTALEFVAASKRQASCQCVAAFWCAIVFQLHNEARENMYNALEFVDPSKRQAVREIVGASQHSHV